MIQESSSLGSYRIQTQPLFGRYLGYVLVLNTYIGSGFLALPWAYQQGGWLFTLILEELFLAVGYLMGLQLLEICSKVEILYRIETAGILCPTPSLWRLCQEAYKPSHNSSELLEDYEQLSLSSERQFDLVQLVRLLLGKV
jgi:hypothetical protein